VHPLTVGDSRPQVKVVVIKREAELDRQPTQDVVKGPNERPVGNVKHGGAKPYPRSCSRRLELVGEVRHSGSVERGADRDLDFLEAFARVGFKFSAGFGEERRVRAVVVAVAGLLPSALVLVQARHVPQDAVIRNQVWQAHAGRIGL